MPKSEILHDILSPKRYNSRKIRGFQVDSAQSNDTKNNRSSDIPKVCKSCEARHGGICEALNTAELLVLNKVANRREWPAGTELIRHAEEIHTYSNVIGGVVKLTKTMTDGREQIVGLQFAPDFLGRPFQDESKVCAEASTRVSLCTFPKSAIDNLLENSSDLKQRLLEQSLTELDEARDWMLALGRKTASEKVAGFIHMIARRIDPEAVPETNTISFDLPLSRADIADFLGLTVETVSRQLTKLRKAGVVEIDHNRHFVIPDINRLERFAGV